jgi:hypothetical protein
MELLRVKRSKAFSLNRSLTTRRIAMTKTMQETVENLSAFKAGQKATIFNTTLNGKLFVEGVATLIRCKIPSQQPACPEIEYWEVKFEDEGDNNTYMRWVEPINVFSA